MSRRRWASTGRDQVHAALINTSGPSGVLSGLKIRTLLELSWSSEIKLGVHWRVLFFYDLETVREYRPQKSTFCYFPGKYRQNHMPKIIKLDHLYRVKRLRESSNNMTFFPSCSLGMKSVVVGK